MKRLFSLALAVGCFVTLAPIGRAQDDGGATSAPAAETTPAPAAPLAGAADTARYDPQLGTMEERVNGLKEQVFRSKATLQLLKEIMLQGSSGGARSSVVHVNDLGRTYSIESVAYYLDGQSIFAKYDPSGSLNDTKEIMVWDGAIPPGQHQLMVTVVLRGRGFGVFNYMEDYRLDREATFPFTAQEGQASNLRVVVNESARGSYVEKPKLDFQLQTIQLDSADE
jgi:hypothetical protein